MSLALIITLKANLVEFQLCVTKGTEQNNSKNANRL